MITNNTNNTNNITNTNKRYKVLEVPYNETDPVIEIYYSANPVFEADLDQWSRTLTVCYDTKKQEVIAIAFSPMAAGILQELTSKLLTYITPNNHNHY